MLGLTMLTNIKLGDVVHKLQTNVYLMVLAIVILLLLHVIFDASEPIDIQGDYASMLPDFVLLYNCCDTCSRGYPHFGCNILFVPLEK